MHFQTINLQESVNYTIRNINDFLTIPTNDKGWWEKYNRVRNEFNTYYKIDDHVKAIMLKKMNQICDSVKFCEPLDITVLDKFYHLHLHMSDTFKVNSLGEFYIRFLRSFYDSGMSLKDSITKYTLPIILDGKYVLFILFDENKVYKVSFIAAENSLDLTSKIFVVNIPMNRAHFNRFLKKEDA